MMKNKKAKKTILDFFAEAKPKEQITKKTVLYSKTLTSRLQLRRTREEQSEERYSIWRLPGTVIVIAEKPKAARKIAYALSRNVLRKTLYGIPYYIIRHSNSRIIVASAAGHLYGLYTSERGYPVFTYEWRPLYEIDKSAKHTEKFIKLLSRVCSEGDLYVNACDYDIEGSVIGYMIIKHHGNLEKSYRAKYSSLTPDELRQAFRNLSKLDWEMIEAGLCRHELDWIWGINISRALMDAVWSASRKKVILSAGRVQTPTLKYVVERDIERNLFIPLPQYSITIHVEKNGVRIKLDYHGETINTRREAEEIARIIKEKGYLVVSRYDEKNIYLKPPPAYNLGDLQEEAARIYGFSPYKTQKIAEKLYLDALISYPRTNSQKLPPTLNYKGILEKLSEIKTYNVLVRELLRDTREILKPVQGPKDDPAHPAIYPTGVKPGDLKPDEWKIYDLIVRRFMAAFAPNALIKRSIAVFLMPGLGKISFQASGQKIIIYGWLKYYPFSKPEEKFLPDFTVGEKVNVVKTSVRRTYTKPPEKLSRIKILRWMEHVGIGTEATRARIIEVLFERKYLISTGGRTHASDLGFGIIEVLTEYFPEITSVELTRYFEEEMENIRRGIRRRNDVVREAKSTLLKLITDFDRKKNDIGRKLSYRLGILKPEKTCLLCSREPFREGLCRYHYEALETLRKTYLEWNRREGLTWSEYLDSIAKLKTTGKWILDLVKNRDKLDNILSSQ